MLSYKICEDITQKYDNLELIFSYLKCIYMPKFDTVLVADIHFGKATSWRKFGIAVPGDVNKQNMELLKKIVAKFQPQTIIILGDFLEAETDINWDLWSRWRQGYKGSVEVIVGNHDKKLSVIANDLQLNLYDQKILENRIVLTHFPTNSNKFINIHGHLHPATKVVWTGLKSQSIVPCFGISTQKSKLKIALPAFTSLSGHFILSRKDWNTHIAITDTSLFVT